MHGSRDRQRRRGRRVPCASLVLGAAEQEGALRRRRGKYGRFGAPICSRPDLVRVFRIIPSAPRTSCSLRSRAPPASVVGNGIAVGIGPGCWLPVVVPKCVGPHRSRDGLSLVRSLVTSHSMRALPPSWEEDDDTSSFDQQKKNLASGGDGARGGCYPLLVACILVFASVRADKWPTSRRVCSGGARRQGS